MTTLLSPSVAVQPALVSTRGRAKQAALWLTQIALAGMFFLAGSMKLSAAPEMVAMFDAVGIGQWFRVLTGGIEVAAAAALLVPMLAPFGALLLIPTMLGASATHLFVVGGSPAVPLVLLLAATAIAWVRRDQLAAAWSRVQ